MGTRSTVEVKNEDGKTILFMFGMRDGDQVGGLLYDFINPFTVVNGIKPNYEEPCANGAGCLALQLAIHLKDGIGGWYAEPYDCKKEKYHYNVCVEDGRAIVYEVTDGNETEITSTE